MYFNMFAFDMFDVLFIVKNAHVYKVYSFVLNT